jgi:putative membrane protein
MSELLLTRWTWHPSVWIGFALWTAVYELFTRHMGPRRGRGKPPAAWQRAAFHLGTLIALIALVSPLDELADEYLFSAHILQHLLLMFVAPPLWLLGSPGWLMDSIVPRSLEALARWVAQPAASFVIFVAVMSVWHIPALSDLALHHEGLHILEHLTFIGGGVLVWRPVAGPDGRLVLRPGAAARMLYLFLLAIPMTALAAILTFSSAPLYLFYVQAPRLFGVSALDDQHLGGLLMWIPTHMLLLLALGATFLGWLNQNEPGAAGPMAPTLGLRGVEEYERTA